jgi:CxxC motif-containing protein (DUF1111 family)
MRWIPSAPLLVILINFLAVGCSPASAPEAAPAEPEGDLDEATALNSRREPIQTAFGDKLPALNTDETARFDAGKDAFEEEETAEDGLGPVFNDVSCAACHSVPATGGGSEKFVTRFGSTASGKFDPLSELGGSLIQAKGIGAAGNCTFNGEVVPQEANVSVHRRTPPLFGLGLVDALPESTFHYIARLEARFFPNEAGRPSIVFDIAKNRSAVGRFGWKGQNPTLFQFSGDAYLNEMGITNPEFPDENCPNGDCASVAACNPRPDLNDDGGDVVAFADFMTLLAPPPRAKLTRQALAGRDVFSAVGCTHCHWSTFRTGRADSRSLSGITFHPYSDFMLHDMGSLGDGIEQGGTKATEMRTPPLWGMQAVTAYLHDGRATTLADAILAHDGQGKRARDRFAALKPDDQAALIAFLSSL